MQCMVVHWATQLFNSDWSSVISPNSSYVISIFCTLSFSVSLQDFWSCMLCRLSYVTRPSHLTVLGIHWKRTCISVRPGSASPRVPFWRFVVNCAFLKYLFIIIIIISLSIFWKPCQCLHWDPVVIHSMYMSQPLQFGMTSSVFKFVLCPILSYFVSPGYCYFHCVCSPLMMCTNYTTLAVASALNILRSEVKIQPLYIV